MRVARQGTFDGLCGVYSIINALDLVGLKGRRSDLHTDLFIQLTHGLGAAALLSAMHDGLEARDLIRASKQAFGWLALEHGVELTIAQPHQHADFTTGRQFVGWVREQMQAPHTAVILHIDMPGRAHWSVAKAISGRRVFLRDSGGMSQLPGLHPSLRRGPCRLTPSETLVVQRRG